MNKTEILKKAKNILAKAERDFDPNVTKNQLMTQPMIVGSWGAHNCHGRTFPAHPRSQSLKATAGPHPTAAGPDTVSVARGRIRIMD